MNNYYYIIAGLPEISPDFSSRPFSYKKISEEICEQLSASDRRLVKWMEYGFVAENLSSHYYRRIPKLRNKFLSEYINFDRNIRNAQVVHLIGKEKAASSYTIGEIDEVFEGSEVLGKILKQTNIIEREMQIDQLKWDRISEMMLFKLFDIDVILAFLVKCHIVERWSKLDRSEGARLFEKLVEEVRGTFKGIDFK